MISFNSFELGQHSEFSILNIYPNNIGLPKFINHQLASFATEQKILQKPTPITVADKNPGLSFSTVGMFSDMSKEVVFTHGNHIYEFFYIVDKENFKELQYNNMIKSIKFLD